MKKNYITPCATLIVLSELSILAGSEPDMKETTTPVEDGGAAKESDMDFEWE